MVREASKQTRQGVSEGRERQGERERLWGKAASRAVTAEDS